MAWILQIGLWHHRQVEKCSWVWHLYLSLDVASITCRLRGILEYGYLDFRLILGIKGGLRGILVYRICTPVKSSASHEAYEIFLGIQFVFKFGLWSFGVFLGLVFVLTIVFGITDRLRSVLGYGIYTSVWLLASRQVESFLGCGILYFSMVFDIADRCRSHIGYGICTSVWSLASNAGIDVLSVVFDITGRLRGIFGSGICTSIWSLTSQADWEVFLGLAFVIESVFWHHRQVEVFLSMSFVLQYGLYHHRHIERCSWFWLL